MPPSRIIHLADAVSWLANQSVLADSSIITSLPDISEFPSLTLAQWQEWFTRTAALVLTRCPDDGLAVFFQTDIKKDGIWVDKGFLCQKAAADTGHALIAHKIICRTPPGTTTYARPAYSHLLCFSKKIRVNVSASHPDVLPSAGPTTWARGMGLAACRLACRMVLKHTETRTIVDPFCGHGTVLAVANAMGMNAVGVELSRKRADIARTLTIERVEAARMP